MSTTLFLHQLIGPIFVIMAVSMFINADFYQNAYKEMKSASHYLLIAAVVNLVIGLSIILKHNYWEELPEIVISLFGWLALLKGLHIILAPNSFMEMTKKFMKPSIMNMGSFVILIIGAYMSYVGYIL